MNRKDGMGGSILDLFGHSNKSPGSIRHVEFRLLRGIS
jgi:hypothetical protein